MARAGKRPHLGQRSGMPKGSGTFYFFGLAFSFIIAAAYDRLWNHAYDSGASEELYKIIESEHMPSDLAATDAPPTDETRLARWQERVFRLHGLATPDAA